MARQHVNAMHSAEAKDDYFNPPVTVKGPHVSPLTTLNVACHLINGGLSARALGREWLASKRRAGSKND